MEQYQCHGWFSYELKVKTLKENKIHIVMGSTGEQLEVRVTVGDKAYEVWEKVCARKELIFPYTAGEGCNSVKM